jgi:D-beta-D-heptose 7-phosphate kinase/D-beta-D-heptose 1-phosphate adenosyltransferase
MKPMSDSPLNYSRSSSSNTVSLPDFGQASVLVVGDVMLDRYWSGDTARISPEAPIPVVKIGSTEDRVGGAGNVALNLASLGVKTRLLGMVGKDESARILESKLEVAEVKSSLLAVGGPTITKLRVMSRHQQMLRLDFEESFEEENSRLALNEAFIELIGGESFGAIIFSDYAKGTLSGVQELIALAKQKGIPCLVDPKGSDFSKYKGASLITPNRSEFEAVAGVCKNEEALLLGASDVIEDCELEALLVTRSEEGMTLFKKAAQGAVSDHFPASASDVFDVTGAGDTVIACLAASLAAGKSHEEAVTIANTAAGLVVAKSGTVSVVLHELQIELSDHDDHNGVLPVQQLKALVKQAQNKKQKVVMTNGCFDILHAGHVSYLEEAKRLGDKLIVAVNSDESVKRLKGEARPINALERRMQVLAGLQAVDWVVSFSEDTPAGLVADILPDILVKGGDWKVEEIAGGEAVVANGGEVISLSFKEGHSTTAIIDLIKEREKA